MNDKPNIEVETLKPFTKFIYTLGQLPSSYLASMSYEEQLIWLCNYLAQTVIPTVNNNGAAVTELQELFAELQIYVNNYFDNLDVQEEIDAKLDEMAEDGTLTSLISAYVDPIYEAFESNINTSIDTQNSLINTQNQEIASFENTVNNSIASIQQMVSSAASGSPAGVYATVAALEAADPDHDKIYLVTADGKWYYYDTANTQWAEGGTYQSTGIGDNSIDTNNLVTNLQYSLNTEIPVLTYDEGHYIAYNGTVNSSSNFYKSSPIHLNIGDKIEFKATGYLTNVGILSTFFTSIKYDVVIRSADSNEHTFTHTALYEGDYYISSHYQPTDVKVYRKNYSTTDSKNLYTQSTYINNIIENKTSDESFTEGSYITSAGSIYTSSNYDLSDYIEVLPEEYITIKTNASILKSSGIGTLGFAEFDKDQNYVTGTSYGELDYVTVKTNSQTRYIRFTLTPQMKTGGYNVFYSSLSNELANIRNEIDDKALNYNILRMFSNITCIGDSLTYSQVYTGASTYRQAYKPYPTILGIMTGATIANLAYGGDSATGAWNRWSESITNKTNQLTIIYLGTNQGLTDTVDTDCVGDDYTTYANTNTGNYGKIIKKSLDVGSKVILVKCYAAGNVLEATNTAIEALGTRFDVPVIPNTKLTENIYHYYPDLTGTNSNHYNDLGYEIFTENLVKNVNKLSDTMKTKILPQ